MYQQKIDFTFATYFNVAEYLQNKADAINAEQHTTTWTAGQVAQAISDAGLTPQEHFRQYGAWERAADGGIGINPSRYFDLDRYYTEKAQQCSAAGNVISKEALAEAVHAANLDPLSHYAQYGYAEGLVPRMENLHFGNFSTANHLPLSGDIKIDSLITEDINWNAVGKNNTITFAFAQSASEVAGRVHMTGIEDFTASLTPYTQDQQSAGMEAFSYLSGITGIQFAQTDTAHANIILYDADLSMYNAAGITVYKPFDDKALVVMDNSSLDLPEGLHGGDGRKTLIHELGHALGLKHPFETIGSNGTILSGSEDSLYNTLMSYIHPDRDSWLYTTASNEFYAPYDIMALQYLYGTDGLNGMEGLIYSGA